MKNSRAVVAMIVLISLVLTFAGCGAKQTPTQQGGTKELKIGGMGPLSGASIGWGYAVVHGAELAAEEINQAGGLKVGDQTYTIKVLKYDDLYTGEGGVAATNRLISEDGVKYIIGPIGSAPGLASRDVAEPKKVIRFVGGYAKGNIGANNPFTFRVLPSTAQYAPIMTTWLAKRFPDKKKIGIIAANDDTGKQVMSDNTQAWEGAGASLVFKDFYESTTQDFTPLLTKMLAKSPDIIDLAGNSPGNSGLILKQARDLGYKGQVVKVGGPGTSEILKVAGNANTEGLIYYSPMSTEDPKLAAFSEKYSKKYTNPMNGFTPFFYDGTKMLFEALKKAGTVEDSEKVKDQLAALTNFDGLLGPLSWGGKAAYGIDRELQAPFFVNEVKGGKEITIEKLSK